MRKIGSKQVISAVMEVAFFVVFVICFRTMFISLQNASGEYNLIEALLQTRTALIAAITSGLVIKILKVTRRTNSNQFAQATNH